MSQSDYLKHKKIANELNIDHSSNHAAVLDSQNYLSYRSYALQNEIVNSRTILNRITPSGKQMIFGVEKNVTNCPAFIDCSNTHLRPNRVLNSSGNADGCVNVQFNPLNWHERKHLKTQADICDAANTRAVTRRVDCTNTQNL
jgi:hypothetical protein